MFELYLLHLRVKTRDYRTGASKFRRLFLEEVYISNTTTTNCDTFLDLFLFPVLMACILFWCFGVCFTILFFFIISLLLSSFWTSRWSQVSSSLLHSRISLHLYRGEGSAFSKLVDFRRSLLYMMLIDHVPFLLLTLLLMFLTVICDRASCVMLLRVDGKGAIDFCAVLMNVTLLVVMVLTALCGCASCSIME